jgi:endoglycosylceramidase
VEDKQKAFLKGRMLALDIKNINMKHVQLIISGLSLLLAISACTLNSESVKNKDDNYSIEKIKVEGERFIDQHGRQVLLNGVNLVNKNPKQGYIGPEGVQEFESFKKWGFNIIRLGIIWDGLEPEPGQYNEEYLKKIDAQIELAKANGLFVFLDMHQDLFSVKYSDGAPEWATLDEGKEHITGAVWSDAYLISPAVQTSWDNFWANKPVADGVGVQDRYAKAWQHVVKRYADNPTVIGVDIMNEPFAGTNAQMFMPVMFNAYAQVMSAETGQNMSVEEVMMMWADTKGRYEALKNVADKERFSKIMDAVYELNSAFESGPLQAFYQKVANAIREVSQEKILFFNHSYFCNSGVYTALEPFKLVNGEKDSQVVYAAHGYDLLVDTDDLSNSSDERLEMIFERINASGKRMNVPVLIGEWGALGGESPGRLELAHKNLRLFERFLFNNTYWAYHQGTENYSYFKYGVVRPYPYVIAGELEGYGYEPQSGVLTCSWSEKADIEAPTRIYVPVLTNVSHKNIKLLPDAGNIGLEPIEGSEAGFVVIEPLGKNQKREITIQMKTNDAKVISLSAE